MENTTNTTCIPPKIFARNEHGLICDGSITYVYNEDGTINWRKMVKPEFLKPNDEAFRRTGRKVPDSVEGLEDKDLIILLGGLRGLAEIRGFSKLEFPIVVAPSSEYVAAVCSIEWIPNYETQGRVVVSSAIGDAKPDNTNHIGKLYPGPFAQNRAFVRCVRNFLKIEIVSDEEITALAKEAAEDTATSLLKETTTKYGITFEQVKNRLLKDATDAASKALAETYQDWTDIPRYQQFEIIEHIKRKVAEKEKAATSQ
jgi:hypothetical protein